MRYLIVAYFFISSLSAQIAVEQTADSLYVLGKYSQSITYYKQLSNTNAQARMARAYIAIGNYNAAIECYQVLVKKEANESVLFELAKLYSDTKNYDEAKKMFLDLIDIDYKNPNYHYELGKVYQSLKDDFSAQSRFYSVYSLDENHQKALYELSKYHLRKSHFDVALKYANQGLETYPENKSLLSLKAQSYLFKKMFPQALDTFQTLYSLNEQTSFVNDKLSICYEQVYDYDNAIKHLKLLINEDSSDVSLLYRLAGLYEKKNDFVKAEEIQTLALKLQDVSLNEEYNKLAFYRNKQDKFKEALQAYKKALKENPGDEKTNFYIVFTKFTYYKDLETKEELLEHFKKQYPESVYIKILEHHLSKLKSDTFHKAN